MSENKNKPRKKYFPNNIREIRKAPSDIFPSVPYEDFMEWRVGGWELPDGIECVIRARHVDTYKVKEYVYQSFTAAGKRIEREMEDPDNEITIADCNEIHYIYSELKSNDE